VAALAVALAAPAAAHDTWMVPDRFACAAGEAVTLALTSGMEFPRNDHAVGADRLEAVRVRSGGEMVKGAQLAAEADHLAVRVTLPRPGVAAIGVSSKPREITLTPEQVEEYFAEIQPGEDVRAAWAASGSTEWRESYRKHAVSHVRVGDPGLDASFAQPLGLGLEVVPQADPTSLHAGNHLPVQVLFGGAPLAGLALGLVGEGGAQAASAVTDGDGHAHLAVPSAGRWMVRGTHVRPPASAGGAWESDFATLTFQAQPPGTPTGAVAAFHEALRAGDRETALALLASDLVAFEAGGAEMSREEYAASHLGADMEFSAATERQIVEQHERGSGDVAWVLTRSETTGAFRDREIRAAGVETMVLARREGVWRIVHVHWSSHSLE
jgi:uncharacterized GH25 family protein